MPLDDGYYPGTITRGWLSVDERSEELVLCFDVTLSGERAEGVDVTCEHRTGGDYPQIAVAVAEKLGLKWPDGLEQIATTKGREVTVRLKTHAKGKQYASIVTNSRKEADPATVKRLLAKMADNDDGNVPF